MDVDAVGGLVHTVLLCSICSIRVSTADVKGSFAFAALCSLQARLEHFAGLYAMSLLSAVDQVHAATVNAAFVQLI